MKLLIDSLSSIVDWTVNAPSFIAENEHKEYIAGLNDKSLLIKLDNLDVVKKAIKIFASPIDVTEYKTLTFSIWSQTKRKHIYKQSSDFAYKIKINSTNEFYLPIFPTFTSIDIGIEEITQITRIEITALHVDTDYIVISEMVAEKEEIDYDVLASVKEHIEYHLFKEMGYGIAIGQANGVLSNTYIEILNDPKYLEKYAVIKIDDGVNNEIHQIDDTDGITYNFNDNFDGKTLLHNYTNANIILMFPVYLNPGQIEIRLPGIAIWGIDPDPVLRGNKLDEIVDTFKVETDNFKGRIDGQLWNYSVLIDIEARSTELLTIMANVIKKFIAYEVLWINGRYHEIYFSGRPTEQRALEGVDIIPKIQYSLDVETKQDIFNRVVIPKTTDLNINIEIKE